MKLICTILALLVLTLSGQPVCASVCGDNVAQDECCSKGNCEKPGQKEDKGCKSCNPFQLCGCCAFSAVVSPAISLHVLVMHTEREMPVVPPMVLSETDLPGCWQPPNIAV